MTEWKYGDSWERYPIEENCVWVEKSGSMVMVHDLFNTLPCFMLSADMIYTDPPWNTGNINSFYSKAGKKYKTAFDTFSKILFDRIADISPSVCYLEIGKQNFTKFVDEMMSLYPHVQTWKITYYKKNSCFLIRGGESPTDFDFTGHDDMATPRLAMQNETFSCIGDLCMGRGLTGISAYRLDKNFVGTELNRRRLAVLIDKTTKLGAAWSQ